MILQFSLHTCCKHAFTSPPNLRDFFWTFNILLGSFQFGLEICSRLTFTSLPNLKDFVWTFFLGKEEKKRKREGGNDYVICPKKERKKIEILGEEIVKNIF